MCIICIYVCVYMYIYVAHIGHYIIGEYDRDC